MQLTEKQERVLTHALTGMMDDGFVYRNWYAAGKNHHSQDAIDALVEQRLMRVGHAYGDGSYYHCTAAGAAMVGLLLPHKASRNG